MQQRFRDTSRESSRAIEPARSRRVETNHGWGKKRKETLTNTFYLHQREEPNSELPRAAESPSFVFQSPGIRPGICPLLSLDRVVLSTFAPLWTGRESETGDRWVLCRKEEKGERKLTRNTTKTERGNIQRRHFVQTVESIVTPAFVWLNYHSVDR